MHDDLERERIRRAGRQLLRARPAGRGGAILGTAYSGGAMPATAGRMFLFHPTRILGPESEGATPTLTTDAGVSFAAYVGRGPVPVAGDVLLCEHAAYRWIAQKGSRPSCTGRGNTLTFTLHGCNAPVPGASVTFLLGGVPVFTGTTDASGQVIYDEPAPGSYTINWSAKIWSGSVTATVANSCFSAVAQDFLLANWTTPYVCCPACPWPMPKTLYMTGPAGSVTWTGVTDALGNTAWNPDPADIIYGQYHLNFGLGCAGLQVTYSRQATNVQPCSGSVQGGAYPGNNPDGSVADFFYDTANGAPGLPCDYPFPGASLTLPGTGSCGSTNPAAGTYTITS